MQRTTQFSGRHGAIPDQHVVDGAEEARTDAQLEATVAPALQRRCRIAVVGLEPLVDRRHEAWIVEHLAVARAVANAAQTTRLAIDVERVQAVPGLLARLHSDRQVHPFAARHLVAVRIVVSARQHLLRLAVVQVLHAELREAGLVQQERTVDVGQTVVGVAIDQCQQQATARVQQRRTNQPHFNGERQFQRLVTHCAGKRRRTSRELQRLINHW